MTRSILLVEDEELLRESLAELLEEEGFEVVQAGNGREGHDRLLERPFDLVLSDIRMPEMDGAELLRRARRIAPQTPVIVVCAGAKAILDLPATLEYLETFGVTVVGFELLGHRHMNERLAAGD